MVCKQDAHKPQITLKSQKPQTGNIYTYFRCKNINILKMWLKGCVHYIFASLFFISKRTLVKQGRMFFILPRKLFSFLR